MTENPNKTDKIDKPDKPEGAEASAPKSKRPPIPVFILGAVLLAGGIFGIRQYIWSLSHVQTDDAFLAGNLVNVSPSIGGILAEINVSEGDVVKSGQLLAKLDSDSQKAAVAQFEAALANAQSQVPQAKANLLYQSQATEAGIRRAQAMSLIQKTRIEGAGAQLNLARQTSLSQVTQAEKQVQAARAQAAQVAAQSKAVGEQVTQAQQAANAARANLSGAHKAVLTAQKAVLTARKAVDVLKAKLPGNTADVEKTSNDEARYRALLEKDAVTRQQYESVHNQAEAAKANLASLREQIAQAEAVVSQSEAQMAQTQTQVSQTQALVKSAEAQIAQSKAAFVASQQAAKAATEQVKVAEAGLGIARAGGGQVAIQASNVATNNAQVPQEEADTQTALAGRTQVVAKREAVRAAQTQVAQAKANLTNAKKTLTNTELYAPTDGIVVRKNVNTGVALAPGQTILTLTQGKAVWVTANFKETQIHDLHIGQPVDIHVDAVPDKVFHGHLAVIGAATGATVSLLPPDNATGNFTKVVQRIPVRIAMEPGEMSELRQGMSAVATVDTSEKSDHPERIPSGWDGKDPVKGSK